MVCWVLLSALAAELPGYLGPVFLSLSSVLPFDNIFICALLFCLLLKCDCRKSSNSYHIAYFPTMFISGWLVNKSIRN